MGIGQTSATSESGIPDEVSLSFDDIFGALQKRGADAEQALSTIEECLADVQDKLAKTQKQLEAATAQEKSLDALAAQDRIFDSANYFSTLLPAVQANLKNADDLSAFDAVQAVQGPLAVASRQLNEAMDLGRYLLTAREQLFPKLQADAEALKQRGYASTWIGGQLMTITQAADELFKKAANESIAADNQQISNELQNLSQRSSRVVELATQIDDKLMPELKGLEAQIADTRNDVAAKLKLKPQQILQELDLNPDDELGRARASLDAAKAMLLQGRVSAVEEAHCHLPGSQERSRWFAGRDEGSGQALQRTSPGFAASRRDWPGPRSAAQAIDGRGANVVCSLGAHRQSQRAATSRCYRHDRREDTFRQRAGLGTRDRATNGLVSLRSHPRSSRYSALTHCR